MNLREKSVDVRWIWACRGDSCVAHGQSCPFTECFFPITGTKQWEYLVIKNDIPAAGKWVKPECLMWRWFTICDGCDFDSISHFRGVNVWNNLLLNPIYQWNEENKEAESMLPCVTWIGTVWKGSVLTQSIFSKRLHSAFTASSFPVPELVHKTPFSHWWSPSADAACPALSLSLGKRLAWMLKWWK